MDYRKIISIILGSLFTFSLSTASNPNRGILYYRLGMFDSADPILQQSLHSSENSDKVKTCFYLGSIALKNQQKDSAAYYFSKAKTLDAGNPYALIGEGLLAWGSNQKQADSYFEEAMSGKNKKDPQVALAIARAYFEHKDKRYQEILAEVKEKQGELPDLYILEGDIMCSNAQYGEASSLYEQAIYFDPKCEEAYLKYARIYESMNPKLALDMLQKLIAAVPESEIAYLEIGDIAYNSGDFTLAADNYNKYLSSGITPSAQNLTRYSTILFYNKEYDKALQYINNALASDPNNLVMLRLKMYIAGNRNELNVEQANAFMTKFPESEYIPLDYIFYGKLLKDSKNYTEATAQFEKALQLDSSKIEIYKELADAYERTSNYPKAIAAYRQFFSATPAGKAVASDYLAYGQTYYFAADALKGTPDSIHQKSYLTTADSLFTIVTDKSPDNYLGYFWRARALSLIDFETTQGLAKPFYEKALAILEPQGKDKKKMTECYSYLGFYYYVANDYSNSTIYWNKVLAIDPENEVAKRAIAGINAQGKQK